MDEQIEHYKKKVLEFSKSDSNRIIISNIPSKIRREIYTESEKCGLHHATVSEMGASSRNVIISKTPINTEVKIDAASIECFIRYSSVSIPIPMPEYVEYYLSVLDPYYNCVESYGLFLKSLDKYRGASHYQQSINDIISKIVDDFTACDKLIEFKTSKHVDKINSAYIKSITGNGIKGNVYAEVNKDLDFISVDIKAANFTTIRDFSKEAALNFDTWDELIASYTDDEFIKRSKYLREVVFGKIGTCKKTISMCPFYLSRIFDVLKTFGYTWADIDSVNGDDITFKNKGQYDDIKAKIMELYPGFYNISMFTLRRLDPKPFFVKERTDGKIEFKCIPRDSVIESIKKYAGIALNEKDLKFMHNKRVAFYDRGIWETLK